jgi:hypothetical protein
VRVDIRAVGRRLAAAFRPNDEAARLQAQLDTERTRTDTLVELIRTLARQTNHNTLMLKRWSEQSETLKAIEQRHARNAKKSSLLTLDEAVGQ